jgi:hypothetical protein
VRGAIGLAQRAEVLDDEDVGDLVPAERAHDRPLGEKDSAILDHAERLVARDDGLLLIREEIIDVEPRGLAYVLQGGWIIETKGASEKRIARVAEIQTTLGGRRATR